METTILDTPAAPSDAEAEPESASMPFILTKLAAHGNEYAVKTTGRIQEIETNGIDE